MNHDLELAVVDDISVDRELLAALINDYARRRELPWRTVCFSSGEEFLAALSPGRFAVVFLDILMEGIDGMETARRLRAADSNAVLVFVTVESDYALDGYEVEAAGFIIKNGRYSGQRFQSLMERLERRLRPDKEIELEGGICLMACDLCYAEVIDHAMLLHTREGKVLNIRKSMEELKLMLPGDGRFFECHRGIVVNLDSVEAPGGQVVKMAGGDILPVSRRRRAEFERAYAARSIARLRGTV